MDLGGKRTDGKLWVYHQGGLGASQRIRDEARQHLADGYGFVLLEDRGRDPSNGYYYEVWRVVKIRHLH